MPKGVCFRHTQPSVGAMAATTSHPGPVASESERGDNHQRTSQKGNTMNLTIDKDGKVYEARTLPTEIFGYLYRTCSLGNTPEEAIDDFWSEEFDGVPLDIVRPEIISLRRLFQAVVTDSTGLMWHWEIEVAITGDPDWMTARDDLDPDSAKFWEWVKEHNHQVTDRRETNAKA